MPTDITEKGLESIVVISLVVKAGYVQGESKDYDPPTAAASRSRNWTN